MIVALSQPFLSPSLLRPGRGAPAFEVKFLVSLAQARAVEAWIAPHLQLDPHCEPALGNAYRVSSVYCDSPELGAFHKALGYASRKFRLRRYAETAGVFLERKTKWGDRLLKRRTWVPPDELERLAQQTCDRQWSAFWFHRHLTARRLQPTCHVSYTRTAFTATNGEGPMRLTIDRDLVCVPHSDWMTAPGAEGRPLLGDEAILELKFSTAMPVLFRRLVYELNLGPRTLSKYRRAIQVWGMDGTNGERERCRIG